MTLILAFGLCQVARAGPSPDADFANKAALSGLMESKYRSLAEAKTATPNLKSFAQQMLTEGGVSASQLQSIASRKNIQLPTINPAAELEFVKLSGLSGLAFEREYAEVMLADYQRTVALFGRESEDGQDLDFKGYADVTLPTLKHRLMFAVANEASVRAENPVVIRRARWK